MMNQFPWKSETLEIKDPNIKVKGTIKVIKVDREEQINVDGATMEELLENLAKKAQKEMERPRGLASIVENRVISHVNAGKREMVKAERANHLEKVSENTNHIRKVSENHTAERDLKAKEVNPFTAWTHGNQRASTMNGTSGEATGETEEPTEAP